MAINFMPRILPRSSDDRRSDYRRQLVRREAQIGGQLFGPVPKGHQRQFFCLDAYTWIWHEEWKDNTGKQHVITTRYEVRPTGILKSQDGMSTYQRLSRQEAKHLYQATELYRKRVGSYYQNMLQAA